MIGFETGIEKCARIYTKNLKTKVVWGNECKTDGVGTIWLPTLSDKADKKILTKTRLYLGHEVSHVLHSDFTSVDRALKTGGLNKKSILNAIEDVRIERLWELEYTGCQEDFIENFKDFVKDTLNARLTSSTVSVLDKILNLTIIRARERQLDFKAGLEVPPDLEKVFQEKVGDLLGKIAKATTMKEIESLTNILYDRFKSTEPPPKEQDNESKDSSGKGGEKGQSEKKENQKEDSSKEDSGGEDGSEDTSSRDGNGSEDSSEDDSSGTAESQGDSKSSPGHKNGTGLESTGGEEDAHQGLINQLKEETESGTNEVKTAQDYLKDKINTITGASGEYFVDPAVDDNIYKPDHTYHQLQARESMEEGKQILSFLGQRLRHLFFSQQSRRNARFLRTGPLDSYRIMEDDSDLICKRKIKGRNKDSVVGVLIDQSGSMKDTRYPLAAKLSLAMAHFLEQIKIPMTAIGYTGADSDYRDLDGSRKVPVTLTILKEFNENINTVMGRFLNTPYMNLTYDLDGMKLLSERVLSRREPKKIILVFSDGQPSTGNVTLNERITHSYKEYIGRLRKAGVIVYGFGIELDVSGIFGQGHSTKVSMSNVNEFPRTVFKQLSKLLLE